MTKIKHTATVIRSLSFAVAAISAFASNLAYADIAQSPLFLAMQPAPNIMFTIDNSGSMNSDFLPDGRGFTTFTNAANTVLVGAFRSKEINQIFYDPAIQYRPWQKEDGSFFPDSVPNNAIDNPKKNPGSFTNLTVPNTCRVTTVPCPLNQVSEFKYLAFYYTYKGKITNADLNNFSNYTRVNLDSSMVPFNRGVDRTDCKASGGTKCDFNDELKNFANWYSYYRTRIFTTIAGISQAFNSLNGKQRVGFGQINSSDVNIDGVNNKTVLLGLRDFSGDNRKAFYTLLFKDVDPDGATPLRRAMDDVGQYFSRTDAKGPWAESPGVSRGTEVACRQSYHILMTDGLWNGAAAATSGTANADSVDGPVIPNPKKPTEPYQYKASASTYYNSEFSNTLADVGMYYWNRDLQPNIENLVAPTNNDPAFWQHLVQYTVGLGVDGSLPFPSSDPGLMSGALKWSNPGGGNNINTVDDLWHAAVNSRGIYFSAKNPKLYRESLSSALTDINSKTAAASSVAVAFQQVEGANNFAYQPSFESGGWAGHLKAFALDKNTGVLSTTPAFDVAEKLPGWNERNIVTINSDTKMPVEFRFDKISKTQQTALLSNTVLEYVRGNSAQEKRNNGLLRDRSNVSPSSPLVNVLGDIVNSTPLFVQKLDQGFAALPGYSAFLNSKKDRPAMVYVGANDGMLHGFNALTGVESFAFVPKSVYPKLKALSEVNYEHFYFVDGQLVEGDAFNGTAWKTLLAGSTGAGARSVFMLDVTTPATLGVNSVLWENNADADSDMGFMLGKMEIVRLRGGQWAAIYGNGYDSVSKKAVLYVVDAFTGKKIPNVPDKIVLESSSGANGLSTPALLFNTKRELVTAYAGDLQGNMWKVSFDEKGAGKAAFGTTPLFTAKDKSTPGVGQPITQRPALAIHPLGGFFVLFGTGRYFDTPDITSKQLQTSYGIWDDQKTAVPIPATRNGNLQEQILTAQAGGASLTSVVVDYRQKRGWFVDLGLSVGSRLVGDPFVTDETTVFLNGLTPSGSIASCDTGGSSQLFAFNFLSGGATDVFDTSTSPNRLSVVNTGPATNTPRVVRLSGKPPAPCTGPKCSTEQKPAVCTRKLVINQLDGMISERTVPCLTQPPLRTWRQLNMNF